MEYNRTSVTSSKADYQCISNPLSIYTKQILFSFSFFRLLINHTNRHITAVSNTVTEM